MPNSVTEQELELLHLPELGRRLSLKRAGCIKPTSAKNSCAVLIDDITTCVLYCEVVDGRAMKFGTSGSLRDRQGLNAGTINNILAFQDGRYIGTNRKITDPSTYDKYKRQAPEVIRSGGRIEIWATSLSSYAECQDLSRKFKAQCSSCKNVEGRLNDHFKTIDYGWATRRN